MLARRGSERRSGGGYPHVAFDDHSRYAYVAALPDERGATCVTFLEQMRSRSSANAACACDGR